MRKMISHKHKMQVGFVNSHTHTRAHVGAQQHFSNSSHERADFSNSSQSTRDPVPTGISYCRRYAVNYKLPYQSSLRKLTGPAVRGHEPITCNLPHKRLGRLH